MSRWFLSVAAWCLQRRQVPQGKSRTRHRAVSGVARTRRRHGRPVTSRRQPLQLVLAALRRETRTRIPADNKQQHGVIHYLIWSRQLQRETFERETLW